MACARRNALRGEAAGRDPIDRIHRLEPCNVDGLSVSSQDQEQDHRFSASSPAVRRDWKRIHKVIAR